MTLNVVRTYLVAIVCCLSAFLTGCTSSSKLFDPAAPRLAQKLAIGEQDWCEIRHLIATQEGLTLAYVERHPDGYVGAWMSTETADGLQNRGPIFFYAKRDGRWFRSEEMSEWRETTHTLAPESGHGGATGQRRKAR